MHRAVTFQIFMLDAVGDRAELDYGHFAELLVCVCHSCSFGDNILPDEDEQTILGFWLNYTNKCRIPPAFHSTRLHALVASALASVGQAIVS